jgi:hypothetical protein
MKSIAQNFKNCSRLAGMVLSASLALTAFSARPVAACPACMQMSMTLADELETSQGAVVALPVDGSKTNYSIESVLRGDLRKGKILTAANAEQVSPKYILTTVTTPNRPFWTGKARSCTPEVVDFSKGVLQLPNRFEKGAAKVRLDYFKNYLGHPNKLIADSACAEFSVASFKNVLNYSKSLGHDKIKQMVTKAQSEEQRALYLVMLGAFASSDDLSVIEPMVQAAFKPANRPSLSALLFCYLQTKGKDALPVIKKNFLVGTSDRKFAALEAMRLGVNENGRVGREHVLPVLRGLLTDKDVAGPVIQDLALWADWDSLNQVAALTKLPKDQRWIRISAARYLRTCPKPEAKALLNGLQKTDPELLKFANTPFQKPRPVGE